MPSAHLSWSRYPCPLFVHHPFLGAALLSYGAAPRTYHSPAGRSSFALNFDCAAVNTAFYISNLQPILGMTMVAPAEMGSFFQKRINAQQLGPSAPVYLKLYYAAHLVPGHIFLPILLAIFLFSRTANRHPTLINVIISYIVSSIVACILLYAGETHGPEPSKTLCIVQTGLLNGVPPLWAISVLTLTAHIWNRFARARKGPPRESPVLKVLMLTAPYVGFVIWALAGGYVAYTHQADVNRGRRYFYCSVHFDPFANSMAFFTSFVCFVTTLLEIHVGVMLYRNWRVLRAAGQSGGVDLPFVVRTFVFGMYIAAGMILSLITIWNPTTAITDLYGASIGLVVVLVFGSQGDVWRVICFWRKAPSSDAPQSVLPTLPPPPPPMSSEKVMDISFSNPWDPEAQTVRGGGPYDGMIAPHGKRLAEHRVTVISRPSEAFDGVVSKH